MNEIPRVGCNGVLSTDDADIESSCFSLLTKEHQEFLKRCNGARLHNIGIEVKVNGTAFLIPLLEILGIDKSRPSGDIGWTTRCLMPESCEQFYIVADCVCGYMVLAIDGSKTSHIYYWDDQAGPFKYPGDDVDYVIPIAVGIEDLLSRVVTLNESKAPLLDSKRTDEVSLRDSLHRKLLPSMVPDSDVEPNRDWMETIQSSLGVVHEFGPKLTKKSIDEMARAVGKQVPEQLATWLLEFNGGVVDKNTLGVSWPVHYDYPSINYVYGYNTGNNYNDIVLWNKIVDLLIGQDYFAFGCTNLENQFLVQIQSGSVWIMDMYSTLPMTERLFWLCESLAHFASALE